MRRWTDLTNFLQKGIEMSNKETALKKAETKYIAEISEGELAIRMAEAAIGIKRPPGKTMQECLDSLPADWGEGFHRAAKAAMAYWAECIEGANQRS